VASNGLPFPEDTLAARIKLFEKIREVYKKTAALYGQPNLYGTNYSRKSSGKGHGWEKIHRHIHESILSFVPQDVAVYPEYADPSSLVILAPEATYRLPLLKPEEVQVEYVQERSFKWLRRRPLVRKTASIPLPAATY